MILVAWILVCGGIRESGGLDYLPALRSLCHDSDCVVMPNSTLRLKDSSVSPESVCSVSDECMHLADVSTKVATSHTIA